MIDGDGRSEVLSVTVSSVHCSLVSVTYRPLVTSVATQVRCVVCEPARVLRRSNKSQNEYSSIWLRRVYDLSTALELLPLSVHILQLFLQPSIEMVYV